MSFKYASLFSGVGGFETALNRLGGECVCASEIDKHARKAYETLYGIVPAGDVKQINAEDVPDHDLLVAGFPCQAFSVAGKRLGFEDTRGTLFFEVARIAKAKRPRLLLLENVKGLISHDGGRTLDTIILTLCDIGYTVDFNVLNSKYFGVPQSRERIYIICVLDGKTEPWNIAGNDVVAKGKRRISKIDGVKTFNFDWPTNNTVTTRLRDILEDNVDERYYLSEEKTAKLVAQLEESQLTNETKIIQQNQQRKQFIKDVVGTLHASMTNNQAPKVIEPQMLGHIDLKGHDAIKSVYSAEGVSPTLTTMGGGHREPKIAVQMNRHEIGKETDISHCLMARDYKGFGNQDMTGIIEGEKPRYRIRKLTPLECFRLQGFPDEYYYALKDAGISDSQLYKMAGNAVTVNVVEEIGRRLLPMLDIKKEMEENEKH